MIQIFKYELMNDNLANKASLSLGLIKNVVLGFAVLIIEDENTPKNVVANTMFDFNAYTSDHITKFDYHMLGFD